MTSVFLQPKPLADPSAAADRSAATARSTEPPSASHLSSEGALLRALLAGAVALLVMLLPAQPAASRDEVAMVDDGQREHDRISSGSPSRWHRAERLDPGARHRVLITVR